MKFIAVTQFRRAVEPPGQHLMRNIKLRLKGAALLAAVCLLDSTIASVNEAPIVPQEKTVLFDASSPGLEHFYTWLAKFGRSDPDKVFSVVDAVDGAPAIRISGQHFGGIVTHKSYMNYRLICEFRWGSVTWAPRKEKARDSGILIHSTGPDGNSKPDFKGPWSASIEYQIIEGGTGDIIVVSGFDSMGKQLQNRIRARVVNGKVWSPAGEFKEFVKGRVDWQYRDPKWRDTLSFRGQRDVEFAPGMWNRIEIECNGASVDYFLNGHKVNEVRESALTSGRILIQSEGAELFIRKIELLPL